MQTGARLGTKVEEARAVGTTGRLPISGNGCWIDRATLDDGLTVVRSHYQPTRDLAEASTQNEAGPTLVITYGLSGESGFVAEDGASLRFGAGRTTLAAFAHTRGERHFRAETAVRQLRLVLNGNALSRYLGEAAMTHLASRKGIRLLGEHPTTAWCRTLLHPLLSPEAATPVDRHIAALTLAAEHLRPLMPASVPSTSSLRLSAADVEKLSRARDLMHTQMDRALTIPYLSVTVGLNECKFKQGFRELYGATPHQFLFELRMRRARTLLQSGCQVAQAAYAVGYRHPASFSAAFARYFGQVPKSVSPG
ncbi:AraC family transcriptional regulator [Diaphorobacter sp. HDW4A]|uniref:helix-turn-helix domain-containing protein n=1 Tax=Comamonadaceae TaxID=80864 RepID=UPI00197EF668|nr:AraC family transcriptional regulator [Diaphorobacter sp. HDW4A]